MKDKNWQAYAKKATLIGVAFLLLGFSLDLTKSLKLSRKGSDVSIEIAHAPKPATRWIYVTGNSPEFTTGSLIQSEGENCTVIHRLKWRVPQVGILEVRVDFRDSENKILDSITRQIIMGAEPEGQ